MEQLILIVPSALTKNFNYNAAKKSIASYIGTRLIEVDAEDLPGMIIKDVLGSEDKQAIKEIVFPKDESGVIVFVEIDEGEELNNSYLSAKAL